MKKILSMVFMFSLAFILFGCGSGNKKTKEDELYFDYTGIAETTHIAFTSEETFDLKTIFKVGDRRSAYDKKIGVTTYDDVLFYIDSTDFITENSDAKIDDSGIVTKKQLSTVVIYAKLKDESGIKEEDKANGGMHILTLFFGNDKTFGIWEAPNDYLDLWIEDKIENGETDAKKATMVFEFRSDFSYTLTVTEGYWGTSSINNKISSNVITGKLYGSSSSGAVRHDDTEGFSSYDFELVMNDYGLAYDMEYTLFTGYSFDDNPNTWSTVRFLPKEK